jgi:hypothetical protein
MEDETWQPAADTMTSGMNRYVGTDSTGSKVSRVALDDNLSCASISYAESLFPLLDGELEGGSDDGSISMGFMEPARV